MSKAVVPTMELELDLEHLDFDLPGDLITLDTLERFERQVEIGFGDAEAAQDDLVDAYTRIAYHVHMILQNFLWRKRLDEEGRPLFEFQEDYLNHLAERSVRGFSVPTMKKFHTAIRMARHLGYTRAEIEQRGIHIFSEVSHLVKKDYTTGEPTGLNHGSTKDQEVKKLLVETIEELTTSPGKPDVVLKPRDFKLELQRRLAPGRPQISFRRYPGQALNTLRWEFERTDDEGQLDFQGGDLFINWQGNPPTSVVEWLHRKLGVDLE